MYEDFAKEWALHFLAQIGYQIKECGDDIVVVWDQTQEVNVTVRHYLNWQTYDEAYRWREVVVDPCEKDGLLICFNLSYDSLFVTRTDLISNNPMDYKFYRRVFDGVWAEYVLHDQ